MNNNNKIQGTNRKTNNKSIDQNLTIAVIVLRTLCSCDPEKMGVAMLTEDKTNFKTSTIIRDKEGYFIMMKGPFVRKT